MTNRIYQIIAIFFMLIFYGIYFIKMLIQKNKGIVTDQIAKGKKRDKSFYTELLMKIATILAPITELISIIIGKSQLSFMCRIFGVYFAVVGVTVFGIAVYTMRDSWRAGVAEEDKEKRNLVTNGIYNYSRNPAFLGFDLVYIGILLMYFNPVLLAVTLFAMIMFHLQILREEKFLESSFGKEYIDYKNRVSRYAGMGKITYVKIVMYIYFLIFIWSVLYFFTCIAYGGGLLLSWVWLWILIAVFSFVRIKMLIARINGTEKFKVPPVITWIYRVAATAFIVFFLITEAKIVDDMTAIPERNLDYVIVLGAGLNGTEPSNPYRVRIKRAGEYLSENEKTIVIASGGQGEHEQISEAECAKRVLIRDYGIDESRILLENKSTDTHENLKFSLEIIGDPTAHVGIVTNSFHEHRALSIAKKVGFENAEAVPATTLLPVGIHYVVREFFGMVEFYIRDM
ncbi:ElyC/SanA/YdcF family protein [Butyrivibrio sp. INlla21]|uniref:ElyC/SanA/YdcF family protein n=1 Tax=Butyrivibrio sp. INlla21 TaxID=1520811 RepID=UPI0008F3072C|nr:ElyC/SanA/YdcF family protein [Butyrivibrio sp. INlla21]SFU92314.1 Protein-S-isoprenylcysteine O-methyltransferase Ste14 [Butyrivibrio sp. INlla21]